MKTLNTVVVNLGAQRYEVSLATGEAWVAKSRRGRIYLSSITSAPKLRKLMKLAAGPKVVNDGMGTPSRVTLVPRTRIEGANS